MAIVTGVDEAWGLLTGKVPIRIRWPDTPPCAPEPADDAGIGSSDRADGDTQHPEPQLPRQQPADEQLSGPAPAAGIEGASTQAPSSSVRPDGAQTLAHVLAGEDRHAGPSTPSPRAGPFARRPGARTISPVSKGQIELWPRGHVAKQPVADDVFDLARNAVLDWVARKTGGAALPEAARRGEGFVLDELAAQRTEAIALTNPRYWALRNDDACAEVVDRTWHTEASLAVAPSGAVLLGYRLHAMMRGEPAPFTRTVPGFVRQLGQLCRATLDGRWVEPVPWMITEPDEVGDLVDLIRAPARRSDVIVLSSLTGGTEPPQTGIDSRQMARAVFSAAHVVVIAAEAAWKLTDLVRMEYSVFNGAVRTYRPGALGSDDEPRNHPLALASSIAAYRDGGSRGFLNFQQQELLRSTVSRSEKSGGGMASIPSFAEVRRVEMKLRRQTALAPASDDTALKELKQELDRVSHAADEQEETYLSLLQTAEQERDGKEERANQAEARALALQHRVGHLEAQMAEQRAEDVAIPADLEGFKDWCERHLSSRVELVSRAYRAARKSQYEDPSFLYRALLVLRDYYVPMRREGGLERKETFTEACQALGLDESPSFAGARWGLEGEEYFVSHRGRRQLLDRHLKKGSEHNNQRTCFRLYFFWDEELQIVVVGSLPAHLDTRIT